MAVASTSGTTGAPTFYAFTAEDVATTDELWGRALRFAGVRPGDTVLHGFGLSMFLAGVPGRPGARADGRAHRPRRRRGRLRAAAAHGRPRAPARPALHAVLRHLPRRAGAEAARPAGRTSSASRSSAAPASPAPASRGARRTSRRRSAPRSTTCSAARTASCACSRDAEPTPACTCSGEDTAVVTQLVDQETKAPVPLADGAIGERVKTSLRWQAQPQLRASVGDVYQVHTAPCAAACRDRASA